MSDHDDEITRVEDLPDFDENAEEEDFTSLDDLAKSMNLDDLTTESDLPDLPSEDSLDLSENSFDLNEDSLGGDTDDDFSFDSPDFESEDDNSNDFFAESDAGLSEDTDSFNFNDNFEESHELEHSGDYEPSEEFETPNDEEINQEEEPPFFESTQASIDTTQLSEQEAVFPDTQELAMPTEDDLEFPNLEDIEPFEENEDQKEETTQIESSDTAAESLDPTHNLTSIEVESDKFSKSIEMPSESEGPEAPKLKYENAPDKTPIMEVKEELPWQSAQSLEDITRFGEKSTYANLASPGNPPFSLILKNPKYQEDVEDIADILKQVGIITEDEISHMTSTLSNGQYLISRISEYAAIILCHKLRRFDVEILMGLTEQINPPKSYESEDRGLLTKASILNNKKFHYSYKAQEKETILTTTLPHLDGHIIKKYLGIITKSEQFSAKELSPHNLEDEIMNKMDDQDKQKVLDYRLKRENYLATKSKIEEKDFLSQLDEKDESSNSNLDDIYTGLVEKLKENAYKHQANGVVGINFIVTPLPLQDYRSHDTIYQIQCSGNMVWLEKR